MSLVAVSGTSRGIGRAAVLALAGRGVHLALIARASAAQSETERLLAAAGANFTSFYAELSDADACQKAAREVLERAGVPDAVIHNAGFVERKSIESTDNALFDALFAVNLRAPFVFTREWLAAMRARGQGRLVYVGSISATLGSAGAAAYAASKWGLVGFVKSLAEEIKNSGLSAVCVLPGSVDTEMLVGSGFPPRMSADTVAQTLVHYALDAPLAHNGGVIEMFGV